MLHFVRALSIAVVIATNASAAVFQFSIDVETKKGNRGAFLWIPPKAEQIRGVVIGGMTLMEREFAQDPRIRQACADEQLAIVFLKCGLGATDIQAAIDRFAEVSGYRELSVAPLMFIGHSAGGPQARRRVREYAERCFGLIQYRGADPGDVDHDRTESIPPGIPALMMIGQFDEFGRIGRDEQGVENWEKDRDKLAAFRQSNNGNLGSILVEPGAGHFAWSDRNAEYLALFIPRAANARIPARWPIDSTKPVKLKQIDATRGWLTDLTIEDGGKHPPAPWQKFAGDKQSTAWHFDETMAMATTAYHEGLGRSDQFIQWKDAHRVNAGARNFFDEVQWVGEGDVFEVRPVYSQTYPKQVGGRGSRWGRAGESVGHSTGEIAIKHVSGPITVAGKHRFGIHYNELAPATESARVTFMAFSRGDDDYRYTERVGMISKLRIEEGRSQKISFPDIGDLTSNSAPVELSATSDAGLAVRYHVAYGPAAIVGGKLTIKDLPRRTPLPITVKVVAWQFGRALAPRVQTANPVEQSLKIVSP